jgi:hypothetical protein
MRLKRELKRIHYAYSQTRRNKNLRVLLKTFRNPQSKMEFPGARVERYDTRRSIKFIDARVYSYANPISALDIEIAEYIVHEWRNQPWIFQKF